MNWLGGRESDNVEELGSGGGGGMGGGFKLGGGLTVLVIIISLIFGKNPMQLLNQVQSGDGGQQQQSGQGVPLRDTTHEDRQHKFVRVVLAQTEDVWDSVFRSMGKTYIKPKLGLFEGQTTSGCGTASASSGPFYCPEDAKVYLDLAFFNELRSRFQAPGELAEAYVIAHEVGHHVQNLLGISQRMETMRGRLSERDYNKLSVNLELQADFLAGVFIHYDQQMHDVLQPGDLESALNAAHAVGDDNLQKQSQGTVTPDAFTHGSSAQRMFWFKKGFDSGDLKQGDTFGDQSI